MNIEQSTPISTPSFYLSQWPTESNITELTLVKEELRLTLEKLRITQEELHKKNQTLESTCQAIEQERQQLQATCQTICKQAISLDIADDITKPKQPEIQLNHPQDLENSNIFVSRIVHDLNNILSPILSISQLLRLHQPNLSEQSQEMLKILEDNARHGANLTKQILTCTREAHRERSPIQVASLLQKVIDTIQLTFPKTIRIHHQFSDPSLWLVAVDSTQLYQVFMNLCVNAHNAMSDGGVLTVSAENCSVDQAFASSNQDVQVGKYVAITVTDTGTGIPPNVRDRIFEPFFTTKPKGQGNGLGLVTVLSIVKAHEGFLQVLSEVGQGTSVKVYLPAFGEF